MANINISENIKKQPLKQPEVEHSFDCGRVSFDFYDNNAVMYKLDGININWFFAGGKTKDGRYFTSKTAKKTSYRITATKNGYIISLYYWEDDIIFVQHLITDIHNPFFICQLEIMDEKIPTETNYLVVLDFSYPSDLCLPLFSSPDTKMLLCPYDNDMSNKYEIVDLKSKRISYDVSAIFNPKSSNGLILGSIDNNIWKNAIVCNEDKNIGLSCISGIANTSTHDINDHGYLQGKTVSSDRFVCGFFKDIKEGLIYYGKIAQNKNGIHQYYGSSPFVWSLSSSDGLDYYEEEADFLYHKLKNFADIDGTTYIILDNILGLSKIRLKRFIKKLHKRGQKVGVSFFPLCHLEAMNMTPLKGSFFKFRKDVVLKQSDDFNFQPIDGRLPIDITIPEAEKDLRIQLREIVNLGFDYIRFDFLSFGALENERYNKEIKTGRQALSYFYQILKEELNPAKIGKEIFIDFFTSPLFPSNFAHLRKCCCDSFSTIEDIKHILNNLTYSYWTNKNLYQFNTIGSAVFYSSDNDEKESLTSLEVKSRYNASIISGVVYNYYGKDSNNKEKTILIANNDNLNKIVRLNKNFLPLTLANDNYIYYLSCQGKTFVAVFNLSDETKTFKLDPKIFNFDNQGILIDLNNNTSTVFTNKIHLTLDKYDSIIFELKKN